MCLYIEDHSLLLRRFPHSDDWVAHNFLLHPAMYGLVGYGQHAHEPSPSRDYCGRSSRAFWQSWNLSLGHVVTSSCRAWPYIIDRYIHCIWTLLLILSEAPVRNLKDISKWSGSLTSYCGLRRAMVFRQCHAPECWTTVYKFCRVQPSINFVVSRSLRDLDDNFIFNFFIFNTFFRPLSLYPLLHLKITSHGGYRPTQRSQFFNPNPPVNGPCPSTMSSSWAREKPYPSFGLFKRVQIYGYSGDEHS
jgi:hypothetical protein